MKIKKKLFVLMEVTLLLILCCTSAMAAEGDVAGMVQDVWKSTSDQFKTIVNTVVFPAVDMVLIVWFAIKAGTTYFEYKKSGRLELTAPIILLVSLIFTLTAPLYIWKIIGN